MLSASSYPTISDVRFLFLGIQQHLDDYIRKLEFSQNELASSILQKIDQYWEIVDSSTLVATVLDPHTKLTLFAIGEESTNAINTVKSHFTEYHIPQPQTSSVINHNNSKKVSTQKYFHQLKKRRLKNTNNIVSTTSTTKNTSGIYEEFDRYLTLPCDDNVESLLW